MPTEKIVEAVALLYASFSRFLRKALKCYAKSRLGRRSNRIFVGGFDELTVISYCNWGIRVPLGDQIPTTNTPDRPTVCSHTRACKCWPYPCDSSKPKVSLHSPLWPTRNSADNGRKYRGASKRNQEEMKREIFGLLQTFDAKWIQRFDELLVQQAQPLLLEEERTADDYVDSFTQLALRKFDQHDSTKHFLLTLFP